MFLVQLAWTDTLPNVRDAIRNLQSENHSKCSCLMMLANQSDAIYMSIFKVTAETLAGFPRQGFQTMLKWHKGKKRLFKIKFTKASQQIMCTASSR